MILVASPEDAAAQGEGDVGCVDAPVHSGADTEFLDAECVVAHRGVVAVETVGELDPRRAGRMSAPSGQQGGEVALLEIVAAGGTQDPSPPLNVRFESSLAFDKSAIPEALWIMAKVIA